ncbi:hypothetical protein [Mycobacteroides chelonae]|uniref:hypothetical protein n=1 Tax=Mycobacteroides chelonae TaxID=1774 RepID=UPI001E5403C1|nr:hypothetical protein [Mycobacteroides chelonae]
MNSTLPRPPRPSLGEWHQFSNMEVWGPNEIAGYIDILEAAQITMAVVPYHISGARLVPMNDPTGYGYAVPTAQEIFYFPSPLESPFLSTDDAVATVVTYLAAHDPAYPATDLVPARLRDGWRMNTTYAANTTYHVADDGYIFAAPTSAPVDQVSSQLSADFRSRHPTVNPPSRSDTGTEIFD